MSSAPEERNGLQSLTTMHWDSVFRDTGVKGENRHEPEILERLPAV